MLWCYIMALKNKHTCLARYIMVEFYEIVFVSISITKTITFCQAWNLPSDGGVCFWTLLPEVSEDPFSLSFKIFCCRFLWTKHEINTMFSSSSIVPQTETLTITIKGISPWSSKERIICSREPNGGRPLFFKLLLSVDDSNG